MNKSNEHKPVLNYSFKGKLSYYENYGQFDEIDQEIESYSPNVIMIYLHEVTEINGQAVGYLVDLKNRCKKNNITLILSTSKAVREVLEITNLKEFFEV